jgi:hypothetical protein
MDDSALPRFCPGWAPLLGHNLVRLLYLDEAGVDHTAPIVGVGGVLIHGDRDWAAVDLHIRALIDKYVVEPELRAGFIFHAKDIYHGTKYFDRRLPRWLDPAARNAVLLDLAMVIAGLGLQVVFGRYERANPIYQEVLRVDITPEQFTTFLHQMAVSDCLSQADRWLATHAPGEIATVIHEDGTPAKKLVKRTVQVLRSPEEIAASELPEEQKRDFSFPLKRIIDTVHFAEKAEARPLQLADLVAFILCRAASGKHTPTDVRAALLSRLTLIAD